MYIQDYRYVSSSMYEVQLLIKKYMWMCQFLFPVKFRDMYKLDDRYVWNLMYKARNWYIQKMWNICTNEITKLL